MRSRNLALYAMFTLFLTLGVLPGSLAQTTATLEHQQGAESVPGVSLNNTPGDVPSEAALTIPFISYHLNHHIIVQAQVNGSQPLPFLVDTGASAPLIIDTRTAKSLGIAPTKETAPVSPGQRTFFWAADSVLRVRGDTPQKNLDYSGTPTVIGDLGFDGVGTLRLAGVIGAPLLAPMALRIDSAAHTLTLFARAPSASGRDCIRLPIIQPDKDSARYYVLCPITAPGLDAARADRPAPVYRLLLDTGAGGSVLLAAPGLRPAAAFSDSMLTIAGTSLWTGLLFPQIDLGGRLLTNVVLATGLPLSKKIIQKDHPKG